MLGGRRKIKNKGPNTKAGGGAWVPRTNYGLPRYPLPWQEQERWPRRMVPVHTSRDIVPGDLGGVGSLLLEVRGGREFGDLTLQDLVCAARVPRLGESLVFWCNIADT